MTIENKFPLKLDLQLFADDVDNDEFDESEDYSGGEDDLISAIRNLKSEVEDDDAEDEVEDEEEDIDPEDEAEEDEEVEDEEEDEEDEKEDAQTKKPQSKEKNAEFAAKRREAEAKARAEAELERLKQESPEFKLAQQLSKQFGKTPEEIMKQMAEEELKREAEATKIPIERLRKERETESKVAELEEQLNAVNYQLWQTQINADKQVLQAKYPMLTSEDMDAAVDYILTTVSNVEIPLEQAVYSVHGQKIIEALAEQKVQDKLANDSGRKKKTPLAPNTSKKASKVTRLSADEKAAAKIFGMTEEEYEKYK